MTFSAYLSLARDLLIVSALGYILWVVHSQAENSVKVADMQAVEKQVLANAQTLSRWSQEAHDAEVKRETDMAGVTALIGAQHAPIRLCIPPKASPGTVSGNPASTPSGTAASGGTDAGSGEDIRPAINAYELKYESALASCRSVLSQWPK
jgi:hypothetical protein